MADRRVPQTLLSDLGMHASKQELGRLAMPQVMRSAIQLSYIAATNVDTKLSRAGGSERFALRIIKIERPKSLLSIGLDLRRPEVLASIAVEGVPHPVLWTQV